jgi:hypothetical protein
MDPGEGWDAQPSQTRSSSWAAALAQLPGFPREENPKPAEPNQAARTVSPMKSADDR